MNLAGALEETQMARGGKSFLERFLATLSDEDHAQVLAALQNPGIEATHLARALTTEARKAGFIGDSNEISGQSVRKWRAVQ